MVNDRFCRQFKDDFIPVLREYLKPGDDRVVVGVPPTGDWEPERGDYRDQAVDTFDDGILTVRDISFGVAVRIDHTEDNCHFWIRSTITLRKTSESVEAIVGNEPIIRMPLNYRGELTKVCEAVYRDLLAVFRQPLADRRPELRTIGFKK